MKSFSLFAAAVAMVCVCEAASEAANSARDAARQYGAAVRNCDMAWAVDSMYPPLKRTYADQLASRDPRQEAANARRIMGTVRESEAQAQAEKLRAEGEAEYMRRLAEAYNSQEKKDFYEFTLALDALKASLTGEEKTVILDADSDLAKILMGTGN